jgi:hypothetical protein
MRVALFTACAAVLMSCAGAAVAQAPSAPPAPTLEAPAAKEAPASPSESAPPAAPETAPSDQDAAPGAPSGAVPRAGAERRPAPAANKRRACRDEARRRGLRGREAADHATICYAEARLDCTKQAVAQVSDRRARAAFIRDCLGLPERSRAR